MSELHVVSFGTVHGDPIPDADLVANVANRFRDPHVDPALRQMTGRDQPVVDKVLSTEGVVDYIEGLYHLMLPLLLLRGDTVELVVACVGGRHRSVVIADEVARLAREDGWVVQVDHRHVDRPVTRMPTTSGTTP